MKYLTRFVFSLLAVCFTVTTASAQVTTGSMAGKVVDSQQAAVTGASVIAIHLESGTTYETTTRSDGKFVIINMRVGGPYSVTVAPGSTGSASFAPETQEDIMVNLGVATDLNFVMKTVALTETVTVTASSDAVFSSARTGAATAVSRETLASLPSVRGLISDFTRLTPQTSGANSFGGADNRMNNMTVNGTAFNNSFGLGGQPGDRTGVAPISLEAIEQVQVSIAPYDVRQGNFVGAAVDTVTRSGTNSIRASAYHRFRNDQFVGTEARGLAFNPGTFNTTQTGVWAGAPVVKNKVFLFGNFENEKDARPLYNFRANNGGEPVGGNVTRVLASDASNLASFLKNSFQYDPGSFDPQTDHTPQKRGILRTDVNLNSKNKVSFNYVQLNSYSDNQLSGSTSAGIGRRSVATDAINYANSNYTILENRKTTTGEWNSVIGNTMANTLRVSYSSSDESRGDVGKLFPFVDVLQGSTAYLSFGSEPFTPNNELRYQSYELKNDFTKFGNKHELTGGFRVERYHSDNVFFNCCKQGAWVYSSLDDFYADARDALANPNRTVSPVTARNYQVRYMNLPGLDKPSQPLYATYGGAYAQDVWRPKSNLSITAGVRFDVPVFRNTAYNNANANALTFRDETGAPVQYNSGAMPGANILWSPRFGFNYDVNKDQKTQIRGGSGVFTGQPLYVWISNQLGNTGVLQGSFSTPNTNAFPFSTNVDKYKPTNVTGAGAASYELDVTDTGFRFPQVWRTNLAVDRRLPGGITGTAEFIYNRDVNGIYYINANLPAAQTNFVGADTRPRWTNNRINNVTGNQVTSAIVMKNQDIGRNWNLAFSASKPMWHGLSVKTAYSYGEAKNTIDPGSTAFASWSSNASPGDPNNPGLGFSGSSPGHRFFASIGYTKRYFEMGATSVSLFWESRTIGNTSYVFAADSNGDGANGDLIYIPRNTSEMNFTDIPAAGAVRAFTAAEQATAFEAYIAQDKYLSAHRGEYAVRGAVFLPFVHKADMSITQDVFKNIKGKRNAGQFRIDIQNLGNLINHDWGVSQRVIRNNILATPTVDAAGKLAYRMQVVNGALVSKSYESTSGLGDVYQFMLSFRYSFN